MRGEILRPPGDRNTAFIEACERVLSELPLEGCSTSRNELNGCIQIHAPEGMAFRIWAEELLQDRIKPGGEHQFDLNRSYADEEIPEDPHSMNGSIDWRGGERNIKEHIVPSLTLRDSSEERFWGQQDWMKPRKWSSYDESVSSDSVDIEVVGLDPPQVWTQGGESYIFVKHNESDFSPRFRQPVYLPNSFFGFRQSIVAGKAGSVGVELIRHNFRIDDDMPRSVDGRVIQAVQSSTGTSPQTRFNGDYKTSDDHIDWMGRVYHRDEQHYSLEERDEMRLELWRRTRERLGVDVNLTDERVPYAHKPMDDDPLRNFVLVLEKDLGQLVCDHNGLIAMITEDNALDELSADEIKQELDESI